MCIVDSDGFRLCQMAGFCKHYHVIWVSVKSTGTSTSNDQLSDFPKDSVPWNLLLNLNIFTRLCLLLFTNINVTYALDAPKHVDIMTSH
jgi:hypothetical protein